MRTALAVLVTLVISGCCSHPVEIAALGNVEREIDSMGAKYLRYVAADPAFGGGSLTPEQRERARENERAWVLGIRPMVTSVRNALGR